MKQIIQIKHNRVKNSSWPEANQLAIYKCGQGFELMEYREQIQPAVRVGLQLEAGCELQVHRLSNCLARLPPFAIKPLLDYQI